MATKKESMNFEIGDNVTKVTGDYKFSGVVIACCLKRDGVTERVIVENADGVVHIFSPKQLQKM